MKGGGFEHSLLTYIDKYIKHYDQCMTCLTKPYWPSSNMPRVGAGRFPRYKKFDITFLGEFNSSNNQGKTCLFLSEFLCWSNFLAIVTTVEFYLFVSYQSIIFPSYIIFCMYIIWMILWYTCKYSVYTLHILLLALHSA